MLEANEASDKRAAVNPAYKPTLLKNFMIQFFPRINLYKLFMFNDNF